MALSYTDKQILEKCLKMGEGYVLDFSDRSFSEFFTSHGVDIDNIKYQTEGKSKAKRMRAFLKLEDDTTVANILEALSEITPTESHSKKIMRLVKRLRAGNTSSVPPIRQPIQSSQSINSASIIGNGNVINQIINNTEILKALQEMKDTVKTDKFSGKYKAFMSTISDHISVFTPILVGLAQLIN